MGKTRLALQAARQLGGPYWLCELSNRKNQTELALELSATLALAPRDAKEDLGAFVASGLAKCQGVLILDSCEELNEDARDALEEWLDGAPDLRVLITTRHRLALAGETLLEVEGLSPDDALALFAEQTHGTWATGPDNQQAVAHLDFDCACITS